MKSLHHFPQVYLHRDYVDFRKSINGLGAIVQESIQLDPFSAALFVFCCRRRKKIKILYWDKTGFALWYKKLEQDCFPWPKNNSKSVLIIDSKQLRWLLDGIDLWAIRPHQEKSYKKMC
jgi:transposase